MATLPKILALHGGGMTPASFEAMRGMADLERALIGEYEFVFAQGAYPVEAGYNWIPDPPSKDRPSTSPGYADQSIAALDAIVEAQGPFHAILGY